jgi:transglutaminase-like putative cysteine protease
LSYTAKQALHLKKGDCSEHSALYAAIARAANIPTIQTCGLYALDGSKLTDNDGHLWNESYTKDYGWLSVDSTSNNQNYFYPRDKYIYFSNYLEDPAINNGLGIKWDYGGASPANISIAISSGAVLLGK